MRVSRLIGSSDEVGLGSGDVHTYHLKAAKEQWQCPREAASDRRCCQLEKFGMQRGRQRHLVASWLWDFLCACCVFSMRIR